MPARTIEIYSDTRGVATCTGPSCRQRILWAQVVKTGKKMCFSDPDSVAVSTRHEMGSGRLIETLDLDGNHWKDCPDVQSFKKRS